MKFYDKILLLIISLIIYSSCSPSPEETETTGQVPDKTVEKVVPVEATVVKMQKIRHEIPLSGTLQPLSSVDILAEVKGKVIEITKNIGDRVLPTDTLARIDDTILKSQFEQAKSQLQSAENNLKIAKANLKSNLELYKSGNISKLALNNQRLAVKNAEARKLAAVAGFNIARKSFRDTRITSPIAGLISRKNIDIGKMCAPGLNLYRVIDISKLKIKVNVSQKFYNKFGIGSKARIKISALNGAVYEGYVKYISPQADEITGGFPVVIYVDNDKAFSLRAGMTCEIGLLAGAAAEQLAVPGYALLSKNGNTYLYKLKSGRAKLSEVTVADEIGAYSIISDGLSLGDTIVTVGMKNLGLDTKVNIETLH